MKLRLTKQQKKAIIDLYKTVDVKKLDIDLPDEQKVKYFRFGSFHGLEIASEIIKLIEEPKAKPTKL